MEVGLRFIALGNTRHEVSLPNRRVTLNGSNPTIDIGRSSKNITRGLKASFSNALFDSPILSRTHARLDFRQIGDTAEITLTDCRSTHGTFIDGQKLEPYVPRSLIHGEKITFGVQVTNGPHVHAAKDFRISWIITGQGTLNNLDLLPSVRPSPVSSTRVELGFRVPDDDDSSIEVQASRDNSVHAIEPHVNTYSVPSTDDEVVAHSDESEIDDEGVAESVKSQEDESAATTPESKASEHQKERGDPISIKSVESAAAARMTRMKDCEVIELRDIPSNQDFPLAPMIDLTETAPKKDLPGSSQKHPLDLRDRSPTPFHCDDTESEYEPDDGPEVLPSRTLMHESPIESLARLNQPFTVPEDVSKIDCLAANSPLQSLPPCSPRPAHATHDSKETTLNSRIEGKGLKVIPETQTAFIPARFPSQLDDDEDSDGSDSFSSQDIDMSDLSDSDEDDCNDVNEESNDEALLNQMRGCVPQGASNEKAFPEKKTGSIERPASVFRRTRDIADGFHTIDAFPNRFQLSSTLDVSRPRSLGADPQPHQRAPSPSDAAMAKKDYTQKAPEDTEPSMRKETTSLPPSQPQTTSRLAHSQGDESFYGPMHSEEWNSPKGLSAAPPTPFESEMFGASWGAGAAQPSFTPSTMALPFGLVDAYGDPPVMGGNDPGKAFNSSVGRGMGLDAQGFWAGEFDASNYDWPQLAAPTSRYSYESKSAESLRATKGAPSEIAARDGSPGKTSPLAQNDRGHADRDAAHSNASRLNISNLINEATINSPKIAKKRKANEMSTDEGAASTTSLNEPSSTTRVSDAAFERFLQESELPDAQIRETSIFPPAALSTQDENLTNTGAKSQPSSSANSTHANADAPSLEPPRKKVKVVRSTSKVGGIAKFVSGVAVGVVGVLATIIATAPISVQEEALREMSRGA